MKSHTDEPKEKLFCFIGVCKRFYFSLETLKKHLQKSHKIEYDLLKEEYANKNFNQIYLIIKNQNDFKDNLNFINFKDITSDEDKTDGKNQFGSAIHYSNEQDENSNYGQSDDEESNEINHPVNINNQNYNPGKNYHSEEAENELINSGRLAESNYGNNSNLRSKDKMKKILF